ncbi:hypothetical protein ACS33_01735 [Edwardsiella ictaluri]|nr:hypothetical protein ABY58_09730 [Edwardsiella ictaluri]KOO56320.1 hypothetical protein ACS33_01735 [Edwardsiella ictaluri]
MPNTTTVLSNALYFYKMIFLLELLINLNSIILERHIITTDISSQLHKSLSNLFHHLICQIVI